MIRVPVKDTLTVAVMNLLDDLGGFQPMNATPDVEALLASILALDGGPMFRVTADQDLQNKSRYALYLDTPRMPWMPSHPTFYSEGPELQAPLLPRLRALLPPPMVSALEKKQG